MLPTALALYETGGRVFIADDSTGQIHTYDVSTLAEVNSVTVGSAVLSMVVDQSRGKLYACSTDERRIAVINAQSGALLQFLKGIYSDTLLL
jgi:DNA-binding beta-propeller fold protein YncE